MLRYYIWIIALANVLIAGVNLLCGVAVWQSLVLPPAFTIAVILVDAIVALASRALPASCLNPLLKIYKAGKGERNFYEKIRIRKWKDKVPEMGRFLADFDKTRIKETSSKYLFKFLEETTVAEVMHFWSAWAGLLLLLVPIATWNIILPVVLVNFFLQIPPIFIQRYNRPKLLAHYARTLKKEQAISASAAPLANEKNP